MILTGTQNQVGTCCNGNLGLAVAKSRHTLVNGNQRGRAGRIDGHAGTMPVKVVRDAVGNDGSALASGSICQGSLPIAVDELRPVVAHHADVHGRV